MKCTSCGFDIPNGQNSCPKCGTIITNPPLIELVPDTVPIQEEVTNKVESNTEKIIKGIIAIVLVLIFFYLLYNLLLTRGYF